MDPKVILEWFVATVLPLLITALMTYCVGIARARLKDVADETLRKRLDDLVQAAEQMIPDDGQAKLNHVWSALPKVGRDVIEAAVYRNFNAKVGG